MELIVVGNGMVSKSFCDALTKAPVPEPGYAIKVFGEEPRPAYDRVHLTDYFSGKTADDLELAPRSWYRDRNIALRTGERVVAIDRSKQLIHCQSGQQHSYDKLVLATGSRPFVPPIPGVDLDRVFVYRTIEDLEAISACSQQCRTAAVLGGGLLGLEAAKALRDKQLIPHVVEMAPGLMPRQLDRDGAEYLRQRVERMGVHVHLTKRTQSIEQHGDYVVVRFDSGDSLAVDMVVISAGIRPCDELARDSGLDVGPRGGVVVADNLATSDPNIYAIGECACHRNVVYGLVAPCYQMANALANRFRGGDQIFAGGDQSARLKLLGVDVATFGEPLGEAAGATVISAAVRQGIRKLLLRDQRLVGAMGVGDWPEADRVGAAVAEWKRPWAWELRRFQKTGNLWPDDVTDDVSRWPPAAVVCSCLRIKRSDLTTACQQGCVSVDGLAEKTGASSVCGSCRPLLAKIVGKADEAIGTVAGWRGLLAASVVAIVAILLFFVSGPIDFSESVIGSRRQLDFFWRDDFWKQVSGYALLAVTAVSLLISLRKRWKRISLGAFGNWRMAHGILGCVTLLGVLAHTGWHWGSNVNFWLMSCFIGINLVGGFTGLVTSLECRVSGGTALLIRQWRPRLTLLHILFFWPLPILIAIHVFCIYYY